MVLNIHLLLRNLMAIVLATVFPLVKRVSKPDAWHSLRPKQLGIVYHLATKH